MSSIAVIVTLSLIAWGALVGLGMLLWMAA
jgi:hypothetical protein